MAIEWLIYGFNKEYKLTPLILYISITKLFGEIFAWVFYMNRTQIVFYCGAIAVILNIAFVVVVIVRLRQQKQINQQN